MANRLVVAYAALVGALAHLQRLSDGACWMLSRPTARPKKVNHMLIMMTIRVT